MRLCAVLRAILRPAALVADGCFFLDAGDAVPAEDPVAVAVVLDAVFDEDVEAAWSTASSAARGFIWMILRDRVGGGGRGRRGRRAGGARAWSWTASRCRRRTSVRSVGGRKGHRAHVSPQTSPRAQQILARGGEERQWKGREGREEGESKRARLRERVVAEASSHGVSEEII